MLNQNVIYDCTTSHDSGVYTASPEPLSYDQNLYDNIRWSKASMAAKNVKDRATVPSTIQESVSDTSVDSSSVVLRDKNDIGTVSVPDNAYVTVEECNIASLPGYSRKKTSSFQIGLQRFCENFKPALTPVAKTVSTDNDVNKDASSSHVISPLLESTNELYANVPCAEKDSEDES